jgi:hypothetical protein
MSNMEKLSAEDNNTSKVPEQPLGITQVLGRLEEIASVMLNR